MTLVQINGVDDRGKVLHPARFLPDSLLPPYTWWQSVPTKLDPLSTSLQLKHLGMEHQVSVKTIEMCHDRTKPLELKMFLRVNMNVQTKPVTTKTVYQPQQESMATTSDFQWKEVTKMQQIMEGLLGYIAIMRVLFSFDYGPPNILQTMFNWHFFSFRLDQVKASKEVINAIMGRNAHLAEEGSTPMSITDIDEFVSRILRSLGGGRCTLPDSMPSDLFSSTLARLDNTRPRGSPSSSPTVSGAVMKPTATRFSPVFIGTAELCGQFNSPAGCPRAPAVGSKSCTLPDGKKTLAHRCSFRDRSGKVCGADHPKPKH
jgi:hypothetical protein